MDFFMQESRARVGFPVAGTPTEAQLAAIEWADDRFDVDRFSMTSLDADALARCDLVWWHRDRPLSGDDSDAEALSEDAAATLREYVREGGGLLLGLRAMAAVTDLGFDAVAPDDVGVESVTAPTGPLWKAIHADHPAVADFDDLAVPVADRGTAPYVRYREILPQRGEVLAATVAGDRQRVRDASVVAWHHGDGQVLGVAAPLTFETAVADEVEEARDALAEGLVTALVEGPADRFARPETGADLTALRERVGDSHRPTYHLTPPANWLNDPNGLVRWNGRYHVFYQYNPGGPYHATIHWGHAVSDDLVHWRDEPVALTPSPDGPDRDGCWSGCTVDDDGTRS
jgi:beta-fructofuranosidase